MKATQNWRPAMYAPVNPSRKRRAPARGLAAHLLEEQGGRCAYCTLPVTASVMRHGRLVPLRLAWDHFVPYSYLQRNPGDNWKAACHLCNKIKGDLRFESVEDAAQVILRRREALGYEGVEDAWRRLLAEPYSPWER